MKTKMIWTWAVVLGVLATGILYVMISDNKNAQNPSPQQATSEAKTTDGNNGKQQGTDSNQTQLATDKSGLAISQGKRAVSIAVNEVQGVSGFITVGAHVDVIALIPALQGTDMSAQILLQNVKVLAIGTMPADKGKDAKNKDANANDAQSNIYRTVTLEISPGEGAVLALAAQKGVVSLMLRPSGESSTTSSAYNTLDKLYKGESSK